MRYLTSREEMQQIDAYSIQTLGIPGLVLMEKAALSMCDEITARFPNSASVLIVVERGNNGGDGLALGRMLAEKDYPVTIYEIGGVKQASDSYQVQYQILENLGIPVENSLPTGKYDLVIDGIFGVGLTREVRGIQKEVIEALNQMDSYRIAVDVPSGVDAGSGRILGRAFQADLTITFGLSKVGLVLYPGAACSGEVCVKDIGFPKMAVEKISPTYYTYEKEDLSMLPGRNPWSNKGSYGKVLLVAGSKNMAGAACLCGEAAYRTGSGLVRLFSCEENRTILQNQLPEAILTTYDGREDALNQLKEALHWASVIGFGPGLGKGPLVREMLTLILENGKSPLVIDADGINVLAEMKGEDPSIMDLVKTYPYGIIFTPHLMEMARLDGTSVAAVKDNLLGTAAAYGDERHILVLKDARTIVADGSGKYYVNTSGNHGMSTGGSGDVLTGIICGLLACGASLDQAAKLGVYCHGLAGDEAVQECGYCGLLAGDLVKGLQKVLR